MKWFRFYYYNFLQYYKKKGESWGPESRSLLLVELTVFFLLLLVWLIFDPYFTDLLPFHLFRIVNIVFNVLLLFVFYRILVAKGRSELIFEEFKESPMDTKLNRAICWIVLFVSLMSPMVLVGMIKGVRGFF